MLAVESHRRMTECWLVSEEHEPEETVVDRALEWLEKLSRGSTDPEGTTKTLEAAQRLAHSLVAHWRGNQIRRIERSRATFVRQQYQARAEAQRVAGSMTRSVLLRHETVSSMVGPDTELRRWQLICMLLTIILAAFCVEIWMFYSRGCVVNLCDFFV